MLISAIALLAVLMGIYTVWEALPSCLAEKQDQDRRAQRTAMRHRYVDLVPDSASAFERLGDALRESDDPVGALSAYDKALALMERHDAVTIVGDGWLSGSGIETKIRLIRCQSVEAENPECFGLTMRTRQTVCRACGALGKPQALVCAQCGAALPVDHVLDIYQHLGVGRSTAKEVLFMLAMAVEICAALYACSAWSGELRILLAFAAFAVLFIRMLKKIRNG